MIKVSLVDDHKMVREGLKRIIEFNGKIKVISEANNGNECLQMINKKVDRPDIIIMDINMPEKNGLETLQAIKKKKYDSKILILTASSDIDTLIQAIDLGIDGYLLKSSDSAVLLRAIDFIYRGQRFIQPSLIPLLNAKLLARDMESHKYKKLSDRELEVLKYVAAGLLNKEIGEQMMISERTVKNHISNIFKKIDCTDRTQAALFAIRNGIVKVDQ